MKASIQRILFPTRFAELSRRAAPYVRLLMDRFDAELHVVHVVVHTAMAFDAGLPPLSAPVPGPTPPELLADARGRLRAFVEKELGTYAARSRCFAVMGGVTDELVRHCAEHAIDLVVMGTHADGVLKRMIFGSVGRGVLEGAPCPVLLVPVRDAPH